MGLLTWALFGGLVGWVASILSDSNSGLAANMVIGVLGAFIGGLLANALGGAGMTGFNLYSVLVAVGGSLLLLFAAKKAT